MVAPTKPTQPSPHASRNSPSTFPALADDTIQYALIDGPDYIEAAADFTQTQAEAALAAAIAGNLSELDLSILAGFVLGVNDAGDALEAVELVPAMEVFQSKRTLSNDSVIDFSVVSGVDEHIFTFKGVRPSPTDPAFFRVQISDDDKATFESIEKETIHDLVQTDGTSTNMALTQRQSFAAGYSANGRLVVSQLSGLFPSLRADLMYHNDLDVFPRHISAIGFALTTIDITDVRFDMVNSGTDLLESGEIIYTTRKYA